MSDAPVCPILREPCRENGCAWWTRTRDVQRFGRAEREECAIVSLFMDCGSAFDTLRKIQKEGMGR